MRFVAEIHKLKNGKICGESHIAEFLSDNEVTAQFEVLRIVSVKNHDEPTGTEWRIYRILKVIFPPE